LAQTGDLNGIARALEEREHLINTAQQVLGQLQSTLRSEEEKNAVRSRLRPVIQHIQRGNDALLAILDEKKNNVLGKLQQLRRQQTIQAYKR
jgi:hypothetical protein